MGPGKKQEIKKLFTATVSDSDHVSLFGIVTAENTKAEERQTRKKNRLWTQVL